MIAASIHRTLDLARDQRRIALSEALREAVVGLAPAQLASEAPRRRVGVDDDELGPRHLGEVLQLLGAERRRQHGVMVARRRSATTRWTSAGSASASTPHTATGSFGSGWAGSTTSTSLATNRNRSPRSTSPSTTAGPGAAGELQAHGVVAVADRERMDLQARLSSPRSTGRPRACAHRGSARCRARGRRCSPP